MSHYESFVDRSASNFLLGRLKTRTIGGGKHDKVINCTKHCLMAFNGVCGTADTIR